MAKKIYKEKVYDLRTSHLISFESKESIHTLTVKKIFLYFWFEGCWLMNISVGTELFS